MRESRWQQFDFVIVACVVGLILAGVAMIHSATCGSPCAGLLPPSSYALRQGVSGVVGCALLVGRGGADQDYGSKRWIYLGLFDLQASEVAKLAVLVVLARVLGEKPEGPVSFKRLIVSLGIVLVPIGLVFVEPDLGTSISFLMIWGTMLLV